jgi:predicted transport protein
MIFGNNIQIKPKRLYIGFFQNSTFLYIILKRSRIDLILNLKKRKLIDTKNLSIDIFKRGHWGNGDYLLRLTDSYNLGDVITLIRQSFDAN